METFYECVKRHTWLVFPTSFVAILIILSKKKSQNSNDKVCKQLTLNMMAAYRASSMICHS